MRKYALLACLLFLGVCALGAQVRSGLQDHLLGAEDYGDFALIYAPERIVDLLATDQYLDKLERRFEPTELIAEVRFTGKRQAMVHAMLSEVEVVQVIRGDQQLAGDRIAVYEDVGIARYQGRNVMSIQAATLMKAGEVYIVFVNPLGIKQSQEMDAAEYTGECDGEFAEEVPMFPPYIFPRTLERADIAVIDPAAGPLYAEVEGTHFVTTSEQGAQDFLDIHRFVVSRYGLMGD